MNHQEEIKKVFTNINYSENDLIKKFLKNDVYLYSENIRMCFKFWYIKTNDNEFLILYIKNLLKLSSRTINIKNLNYDLEKIQFEVEKFITDHFILFSG